MTKTLDCTVLNIQALGFVVSEKIFSCFSYYKPMVDNDAPGLAHLDTRGMVGRIYKGNY